MAVRRHRMDLPILFLTLILMGIGLIVIYAIGPMRANVLNNAYGADYGTNDFFFGQLRSVIMSLVAFLVIYKFFPARRLLKWAKPLMLIALGLSVALWFFSLVHLPLARCELGECRWLQLGGFSFQPAELLKIALVIYLADFLTRKKEAGEIGKFKEFWMPLGFVTVPALLLVVIAQGDLGTGIAIAAIVLGMLLVAGVPTRQYVAMLALLLVVAVGSIAISSHRMERIDAWIATLTGNETSESTYHVDNAMLAIGTGGLFGVGIGNSVQATGYLPESINDSVFAIMGETFGFIGLALIIALFGVILWRMLKVAGHTSDTPEQLMVVGVFSWMLAQVAMNIMAMTGLVPVTGITLPFLSYGGTSMILLSAAMGLVLQISCYTSREGVTSEGISSGRGLGGSHHSGSRRSA